MHGDCVGAVDGAIVEAAGGGVVGTACGADVLARGGAVDGAAVATGVGTTVPIVKLPSAHIVAHADEQACAAAASPKSHTARQPATHGESVGAIEGAAEGAAVGDAVGNAVGASRSCDQSGARKPTAAATLKLQSTGRLHSPRSMQSSVSSPMVLMLHIGIAGAAGVGTIVPSVKLPSAHMAVQAEAQACAAAAAPVSHTARQPATQGEGVVGAAVGAAPSAGGVGMLVASFQSAEKLPLLAHINWHAPRHAASALGSPLPHTAPQLARHADDDDDDDAVPFVAGDGCPPVAPPSPAKAGGAGVMDTAPRLEVRLRPAR
jgi:hypothetical protein